MLNEAEIESVDAFMHMKCLEIPNLEMAKSLVLGVGDSESAESASRRGDLWLTSEVESFCE